MCGNTSQETYNTVVDAIKDHSPHIEVLSLAQVWHYVLAVGCTYCASPQVNTVLDKFTGVIEVHDDMCIHSCLAFTGPYEVLSECPYCHEP